MVTFGTIICEVPTALIPPVIGVQKLSYTITEEELYVPFPYFTTDPVFCTVTLGLQIAPLLPVSSPVQILSPFELKVYQDESLDGLGKFLI